MIILKMGPYFRFLVSGPVLKRDLIGPCFCHPEIVACGFCEMSTLSSRIWALNNLANRSGVSHLPALPCILNRLMSSSNDNKSTIKAVSASATEGKKAPVYAEQGKSSSNSSKNVVSDEKIKKKMGKYVEGDKINYKEIHKV